VFQFRQHLAHLSDGRRHPLVSPASVFQAVFFAFVFRLPSFHQLEQEMATGFLPHWIGSSQPFSEDTLRYSFSSFELSGLEQMLGAINQQLKRNKVFSQGQIAGRILAALDGIEILSSYSRCCESCLERTVWEQGAHGQKIPRTQYYHRAVGCQIVTSRVKPLLGAEWVQKGEDEVAAAKRLLEKIAAQYGSRFFDVLLLDALYAQAPVFQLAQQIGWDLVVVLKQENRDLYQDAQGLFDHRPPDHCWAETQPGRQAAIRLWEEEGLPFSQGHPQSVRVLHSEETITENHRRGPHLQPETTFHRWFWISTLSRSAVSCKQLWQMGHARWQNENNGWNDLTQNWGLKHGFLHACQHRPKLPATEDATESQPRLVPNRGLAAVTLTLAIAFVLFSAFTLLHSKLYRLYPCSYQEVAQQLYRSLLASLPTSRPP